MTNKYIATGTLTNSVKDLAAARAYLADADMTQYVDDRLSGVIFDIQWELTGFSDWQVVVITERELTADESAALSSWISGQNSDGLGEGFEQQPFAENFERDRWGEIDEDTCSMASFDWQTNNCELRLVK